MIRAINENEINKFIDFGDSVYVNDANYVPYMHSDLKKTIRKLVFEKERYTALCSFDESGEMNGRILLTVGKNKQLKTDNCGYFSHLEVVDDAAVFRELMDAAVAALKEKGAEFILGSFFPHDPDNRRGILVKGFELSPMIFTSHNPPYYQTLFEEYGFEKLTDAYEYEYREDPEKIRRIKEIAEKALIENDIHISKLDMKNLDRDIEDVHTIMEIASTQVNFENVLSKEEIKKIFLSWKQYIDPDYALIARKNSDNAPVGFTFSVPDYFELIRKMKGRTDLRGLLIYLLCRKKIHGIRGILQYIIPEYQHKGVSKALYYETKKSVDRNYVTRVSLGTIMEENANSNGAMQSVGGELSRIYRIYFKKI